MRKKILLGLIIVAVVVYGWDVFLVVKHPGSVSAIINKEKSDADVSVERFIASSQPVRFVKSDRNPFLLRNETENPATAVKAVKQKPLLANAVKPPDIKINGIMWDQTSPIAMITFPDGSSAAIKAGQSAGDILVKKIEKDRIQVVFQKNSFWISR